MKITDDVREYAKEQGYGVEEALTAGMEKASLNCLLSGTLYGLPAQGMRRYEDVEGFQGTQ